jgi:kynurenine formamidase
VSTTETAHGGLGLDGLRPRAMANVGGGGALPSTGSDVACFPLKIAGASAAPARVVGFVRK